jgi:PAS domain S-box-containing protein
MRFASKFFPWVVASGAGIFLLIMGVLTWIRPGTTAQYIAVQNILHTLLPLGVGLLGLHYITKVPLHPRSTKSGLALVAWGCLAWAFGESLWTLFESGLGHAVPFPGWPDVGYVASYIFFFAAAIRLLGPWEKNEHVCLIIDSLLIAGSLGILSLVFVIQPLMNAENFSPGFGFLGIAYPMTDLAILFSALLILHARPMPPSLHRTILFLTGSMALFVVADSLFYFLALHKMYQSGGWTDLIWAAGWVSIALSFCTARNAATGAVVRRKEKEFISPRLIHVILPYLLAVCTIVLVSVCDAIDGFITNQTFLALLFLISLILVRQVFLLLQNRRLTTNTCQLNSEMAQLLTMQSSHLQKLKMEMAERQRIEKELLHHRETLEETVLERTNELRELNTHLESEITERKRVEESLHEDIAARQKVEEALRKSEEKYRMLIETIPHGVHEIDLEGRITFANKATQKMFGYPEEELKGMKFTDLIASQEERERVLKEVAMDFEQKRPLKSIIHQNITKEGRLLWVKVDCHYKLDHEERVIGLIVIITDLTEQKILQEQLLRSQKLETVGRLAGGIAHDFNNLLTIINGYCDVLLGRISPSDPQREAIQEIQKAGKRGSALTQRLRAFSRTQLMHPVILDLNDLIIDMNKMLKLLIGEQGNLSFAPGASLGRVNADPNQLEQVIINIVVNSVDAMPHGGSVFISTANVHERYPFTFRHQEISAGRYVEIRICDTGVGMSAEAQEHLFEPFFTTKPKGKGIGLGLAMVHGIVHQYGGHILVKSQLGRGTEILIRLPQAIGEPNKPELATTDLDAHKGSGTILLAEDEEGVLKMTTELLRKAGYRVLPARDGHEALRISAHCSDDIPLLITDVMMPGINGLQLAKSMASLRPSTKVLFMSGYSEETMRNYNVEGPLTPFLHKPFTPADLLAAVQETLARKDTRKGLHRLAMRAAADSNP